MFHVPIFCILFIIIIFVLWFWSFFLFSPPFLYVSKLHNENETDVFRLVFLIYCANHNNSASVHIRSVTVHLIYYHLLWVYYTTTSLRRRLFSLTILFVDEREREKESVGVGALWMYGRETNKKRKEAKMKKNNKQIY